MSTNTTKFISALFSNVAKKKLKGDNFLDLCFSLPNRGVGHKITKKGWPEKESYWTVTKVSFGKTGTDFGLRGKVHGVLTWGGKTDNRIRQIPNKFEKNWTPYPYIKAVESQESKVEQTQEEQQ
ncbi:hypothetical protein CYY_000004 [Polysphondylium violaceum]|uniref:Uncharacterized protein n=1 Tax=Polysphondylium violaceum TaxID=133409 RepID=A0A8J4Q0E2_9MYCE|nr:hypothetical protein CYY_000004 [Polysphondylium violaceum]